jgi:hypothetical protein
VEAVDVTLVSTEVVTEAVVSVVAVDVAAVVDDVPSTLAARSSPHPVTTAKQRIERRTEGLMVNADHLTPASILASVA